MISQTAGSFALHATMIAAALLAQVAGVADTFMFYAMIAVAVLAVIGLVYAAASYFKVAIPPLFVTVFWIVLGAVVVIGGIQMIRWMIR